MQNCQIVLLFGNNRDVATQLANARTKSILRTLNSSVRIHRTAEQPANQITSMPSLALRIGVHLVHRTKIVLTRTVTAHVSEFI